MSLVEPPPVAATLSVTGEPVAVRDTSSQPKGQEGRSPQPSEDGPAADGQSADRGPLADNQPIHGPAVKRPVASEEIAAEAVPVLIAMEPLPGVECRIEGAEFDPVAHLGPSSSQSARRIWICLAISLAIHGALLGGLGAMSLLGFLGLKARGPDPEPQVALLGGTSNADMVADRVSYAAIQSLGALATDTEKRPDIPPAPKLESKKTTSAQ